jgi:hypothetical protein
MPRDNLSDFLCCRHSVYIFASVLLAGAVVIRDDLIW